MTSLAILSLSRPYYMSPEVCRSEPYNWKSDIWVAASATMPHSHVSADEIVLSTLWPLRHTCSSLSHAQALGCVLYELGPYSYHPKVCVCKRLGRVHLRSTASTGVVCSNMPLNPRLCARLNPTITWFQMCHVSLDEGQLPRLGLVYKIVSGHYVSGQNRNFLVTFIENIFPAQDPIPSFYSSLPHICRSCFSCRLTSFVCGFEGPSWTTSPTSFSRRTLSTDLRLNSWMLTTLIGLFKGSGGFSQNQQLLMDQRSRPSINELFANPYVKAGDVPLGGGPTQCWSQRRIWPSSLHQWRRPVLHLLNPKRRLWGAKFKRKIVKYFLRQKSMQLSFRQMAGLEVAQNHLHHHRLPRRILLQKS